jgi:hypothetical protein
MQLARGLECVVHGDEEGRLPDGLQHLPLGLGVLGRLALLHDRSLFKHLHGVEVADVGAVALASEKYFAVG